MRASSWLVILRAPQWRMCARNRTNGERNSTHRIEGELRRFFYMCLLSLGLSHPVCGTSPVQPLHSCRTCVEWLHPQQDDPGQDDAGCAPFLDADRLAAEADTEEQGDH